MEKAQILAIGTNRPIMKTLQRLIDANPEWEASILFSAADALSFCQARKIDLILIGAGIENNEYDMLNTALAKANLNIPTVLHYGGGSGLLYPEIYGGLKT